MIVVSGLAALKRALEPQLKASVFNTSISANTKILASDLVPSKSPVTYRIYVCFNDSGVLQVVRTRDTTTLAESLNEGAPLAAGAAYTFDILATTEDNINFWYSTDTVAKILIVEEVSSAIS